MTPLSTHTPRLVTAGMLHGLPEPVQRYLTYTGIVGTPWIDTVRITYAGNFRMAADRRWMPVRAEQVYTTNPPAFHWRARFKMAGLWLMTANDTYQAGHGHMFGKVAGLFKVVDFRGDELDQGTMLRYLNEMTWFPTAFLGDNITWQTVDQYAADVTFTDQGKSVTARLFFDDGGRLTDFVAQRYRENKGRFTLDTWSTPMTKYGVLAGLLPVRLLGVILGSTLLFVPLWLLMMVQGIRTQQAGEAALVYALDLVFLIPAMLLAAVQIWRRRTLGYLLGGVLLVKAAFSGILLTAGSLLQLALGFSVGPDFAMYIFLLVAGLAGVILTMRHICSA